MRPEDGTTRDLIEQRLDQLKREFELGQAELDRVERQRSHLRETMLRIAGAAQVLEELLASGDGNTSDVGHRATGQPDVAAPTGQTRP